MQGTILGHIVLISRAMPPKGYFRTVFYYRIIALRIEKPIDHLRCFSLEAYFSHALQIPG